MKSRKVRLPRLCRHRGRGLAYVTDPRTGDEVYLGPWGGADSVAAYDRWCRDYLAGKERAEEDVRPAGPLTVARLCLSFLDHAGTYYRKHGRPTTEAGTFRQVVRRLDALAGSLRALDFGPRQLAALRDAMAAEGLARRHVNEQVNRVRRIWRWAVAGELLPPASLQALRAVAHLARGRTTAPEEEPVEPVPWDVVQATLPYLTDRVRALVLFQLHGAMRPGEAVVCRPCDVDRAGTPWAYRPWTHKTEHRGRVRLVYLGPRARAVLTPLLDACPAADAWVWASRGRGPHAGVRGHLRARSYALAVDRAVRRANLVPPDVPGPPLRPVPAWFPLQLRHTAATAIRAACGLEAVQGILDHAEISTSQIYAERSDDLKRSTAERLG